MNSSFPVHPTQIYESLVGLALLVLLLWQRQHAAVPRAGLLPLRLRLRLPAASSSSSSRDDVERGSYGRRWTSTSYSRSCLLLFAVGFVFGFSLGITNRRARRVARPRVRARGRRYLALKPERSPAP